MPSGIREPDARRGKLIAYMVTAQQPSLRAVCRDLGVPWSTGRQWWVKYLSTQPVEPQKQETLNDLVLGFAEEGLRTLRRMATNMADPQWFREQKANEYGVALGILADKCALIVETAHTIADARARQNVDSPAAAEPVPDSD